MIEYEGSDGSSVEKSIKVKGASSEMEGVLAEYNWLSKKFGKRGKDWEIESQSLIKKNNNKYDEMTIKLADGTKKRIHFDVTEFYGKWK